MSNPIFMYVYVYVYLCVRVCVCVCTPVRQGILVQLLAAVKQAIKGLGFRV